MNNQNMKINVAIFVGCILMAKIAIGGEVDIVPTPSSDYVAIQKDDTVVVSLTYENPPAPTFEDESWGGASVDSSSDSERILTFGAGVEGQDEYESCTVEHDDVDQNGDSCENNVVSVGFHVAIVKVESSTEATAPGNSDSTRTTIGVGEAVDLTIEPATLPYALNWTTTAGQLNNNTGQAVTYTAGGVAETETVSVDVGPNLTLMSPFSVLAPTSITFSSPQDIHVHPYCDSGFAGTDVIQPLSVSFSNISVGEEMAQASGSGYFSNQNGLNHEPSEVFYAVNGSNSGFGDTVWSGYNSSYSTPNAFVSGTETISIPVDYQVNGNTYTNFYTETQSASADSSGNCSISKNGTPESNAASDASINTQYLQ